MKKFLVNTCTFILCFIVILCLIIFVNRYCSVFKIENTKQIVLIGDSHSECAFDDSVVNGLANYSQMGESYFYSYFKIKKLIDQNPNLNTLLIEISNTQIDKNTDRRIWGDKYLPFKLPIYGSFMDVESLGLLLENNSKGFKASIFPLLKNNTKMLFKGVNYTNDIGGYHYLTTTINDSIAEYDAIAIDTVSEKGNSKENFDSRIYELDYLRKIIEYGESRGLTVFLVRSPLHSKYEGFVNESDFIKKIKTEFSTVEFLDFAYFPLSDEHFADVGHLNYKGARVFSKWFDNLVERGLLTNVNKQNFINLEMKTHRN